MRLEIHRAGISHVPEIVDVLREAAAFMRTRTPSAWRDEDIGANVVSRLIDANELVVALIENRIGACMALQTRDLRFWPDYDDAAALYIHRLAVRRAFARAGSVEALVGWAAEEALRQGRTCLRLDCVPEPRLCARYEGLGFRKIDEVRRPYADLGDPREGDFISVRFERAC